MSTDEMRSGDFIVESVRENGKPFRPSDWVERISTLMATYGADHRLHYSDSVRPCTINGAKSLCVKKALKDENPEAYQFILKFAADNQLRIQEDRRQDAEQDRRNHPPTQADRRTGIGNRRNS